MIQTAYNLLSLGELSAQKFEFIMLPHHQPYHVPSSCNHLSPKDFSLCPLVSFCFLFSLFLISSSPHSPQQAHRVWNAVLGCNHKNDRMISVRFQGKPFNITVIQIYASTTNTKDAEVEWFLQEWPTRPSRTNSKKICPFHHRGLECKSMKSRDTWSNRQVWPWSTKWSRAKANRVLPREHTGHSKYSLPTTQEKTLYLDIIRWSILK